MTQSQPEGFLALPSSGKGSGVLVLHAWWGLNATIQAFCRRLAEHGFVVFAPDLYHGQLAVTIPEAEALSNALDDKFPQVQEEIRQAAQYLSEQSEPAGSMVAVVGFSLGTYYAVDLALAHPALIRSVVLFYGSGRGDFSQSKASFLGHFAENDAYEPPQYAAEMEEALQKAGRPVTIYHYKGTQHWFFEPDRVDAYHPAAADLAWERTLSFLKGAS